MKQITVIARQKIIDPKTNRLHDDLGLCALNGYHQFTVIVDDNYSESAITQKLIDDYPELADCVFSFVSAQ